MKTAAQAFALASAFTAVYAQSAGNLVSICHCFFSLRSPSLTRLPLRRLSSECCFDQPPDDTAILARDAVMEWITTPSGLVEDVMTVNVLTARHVFLHLPGLLLPSFSARYAGVSDFRCKSRGVSYLLVDPLQPALVSFSGGQAPYYISVLPVSQNECFPCISSPYKFGCFNRVDNRLPLLSSNSTLRMATRTHGSSTFPLARTSPSLSVIRPVSSTTLPKSQSRPATMLPA